MQSFYTNVWSNHGSKWINCYLDNNQLFASIDSLLCGRLSIYGGNGSTSVWKVSLHLIKTGFSSDNVIPPSLNNFKQNCMIVKYKGHRPAAINLEAIFLVLDWITSLQYFEPTVIAYLFVIVAIAFSNINRKT